MPPKKKTHTPDEPAAKYQRPWELGDPDWETTPTSPPKYEPWSAGFSWTRLEITLDQLRQSQLYLSNALRLLADSVNTDQRDRDLLVYELKDKVQSMDWRLLALEDKVTKLQAETAHTQGMRDSQITARLDALHVRLLALEGVQQLHGTTCEPAAAELRRELCDQLLRMATVLNNRELDEPAAPPMQARINAARAVAEALRGKSPGRSVGNSRAASPAPSRS